MKRSWILILAILVIIILIIVFTIIKPDKNNQDPNINNIVSSLCNISISGSEVSSIQKCTYENQRLYKLIPAEMALDRGIDYYDLQLNYFITCDAMPLPNYTRYEEIKAKCAKIKDCVNLFDC